MVLPMPPPGLPVPGPGPAPLDLAALLGPMPPPGGPPLQIPGMPPMGGPPMPPMPMMGGGPPLPPLDLLMGGGPPMPPPGALPPELALLMGQGFDIASAFLGEDVEGPKADPQRRERKRKKPSEDWIRKQADAIVEYWAQRDQRMDEDEALYRLSREGMSGQGELVLRNLPYVLVEKAAALLGKQQSKTDVIPPSSDLDEEAQEIEDYLRYKWEVWNDDWADSLHNDLKRDSGHFLSLRGWLTWRIIYDGEVEDEDTANDPVRLTPVDPRQVYPSYSSRGLRYVVHRYETTIGDLIDEWPEAERLFDEDVDPEELTEVTAYYDDWFHCVYAEQGTVKPPTAHEYGFVPWIVSIGMGAPIRATANNTSDWVADVGVSIFHGIKDAYKQSNKILSQLATEIAKSANPALIHYYDPANPEAPKQFRYSAGAINYLMYDRERVEPIQLSPNPRDAGPLLEAMQEDIHMGGLPPILWGAGLGASGYQQSLMADAAEDALFPLVQAMQRSIKLANKRCLELIRDLHDRPVGYFVRDRQSGDWVGGVTIDPETIAAVGTETRVTMKGVSPRDRFQMASLAAMLTKEKLIDLDTARDEYLGIENPSRVNEKVLTDLIYLDEGATQYMVREALGRIRPERLPAYMQGDAAQQGAEGMGPPGMPPGMMPPGMPPPGMPPGMMPPPGMPPGMPGLPPQLAPPIEQAAGGNPQALLMHSLASAAGGAGVQVPPGIPGYGGQIPRPPLPIPGMI